MPICMISDLYEFREGVKLGAKEQQTGHGIYLRIPYINNNKKAFDWKQKLVTTLITEGIFMLKVALALNSSSIYFWTILMIY